MNKLSTRMPHDSSSSSSSPSYQSFRYTPSYFLDSTAFNNTSTTMSLSTNSMNLQTNSQPTTLIPLRAPMQEGPGIRFLNHELRSPLIPFSSTPVAASSAVEPGLEAQIDNPLGGQQDSNHRRLEFALLLKILLKVLLQAGETDLYHRVKLDVHTCNDRHTKMECPDLEPLEEVLEAHLWLTVGEKYWSQTLQLRQEYILRRRQQQQRKKIEGVRVKDPAELPQPSLTFNLEEIVEL